MLKIRCSALGNIMVGASLKPLPLTDKQSARLKELRDKGSKSKEREKLEAKLIEVPTPKLSEGAKTYIEDVFYGHKFDFQANFSNKFTQKGNEKELFSISVLNKYLGVFGAKNEKHFENDYIQGTPDVILSKPNAVIDAKNVYYPKGLGIFENGELTNRIWQIHGYNYLLGKSTGYVARILVNPPDHLIEKEAWALWKSAENIGAPDEDFIDEVRAMYDFEGKQPINKRVRLYRVDTTDYEVKLIKTWVGLARDYYAELEQRWNNHEPKNIFAR